MKRVFSVFVACLLMVNALFMSTSTALAAAPSAAAAAAAWYSFYGVTATEVTSAYAALTSAQKNEVDIALGSNINFGLLLGGIRLSSSFSQALSSPVMALAWLGSNLFLKAVSSLDKESLAYAAYLIDQVKNKGVTYNPEIETSVEVPTSQSVAKSVTYAPSIMPNYNQYWEYQQFISHSVEPQGSLFSALTVNGLVYSGDSMGLQLIFDNSSYIHTCFDSSYVMLSDIWIDTNTGCILVVNGRSIPHIFAFPFYLFNSSGSFISTQYYSSGSTRIGPDNTLITFYNNKWIRFRYDPIASYLVLDPSLASDPDFWVSVCKNGGSFYNVRHLYFGDSLATAVDLLAGEDEEIVIDVLDSSAALEGSQYTIDQDDDKTINLPVPIDNINDPVLSQLQSIADKLDSVVSVDTSQSAADSVVSSTIDISGLDELAGTYTDSVAGVFEPYSPQPGSWLPTFISGLPPELLGLISAMMIMIIIVGAVNRMLG